MKNAILQLLLRAKKNSTECYFLAYYLSFEAKRALSRLALFL